MDFVTRWTSASANSVKQIVLSLSAMYSAMPKLADVELTRRKAKKLLKTQPNEDLETATKALEISEGSLEKVAERYGG